MKLDPQAGRLLDEPDERVAWAQAALAAARRVAAKREPTAQKRLGGHRALQKQ